MSWLTRMFRNMAGGGPSEAGGPRVAGPPRSPNGASSFHVVWELPGRPEAQARIVEVSAVLEVLVPPRVQALHFWALQVDFADGRGVWGGGHTGLQWNQRYPDRTAVNWGGYASAERGGAVLAGTESSIRGFPDDPNTLAYPWRPGRPYQLRIFRSPANPGAWRAVVADLGTGHSTIIRDLLPPPDRGVSDSYLARPIVWSEVFADCDAPSVTVRWSELVAVDEADTVLRPEAVRVNYQSAEEGGCANTSVSVDQTGGILQVTNVPRAVGQGAVLVLPRYSS